MHSINKGVILQPQSHFWGATGHGPRGHGVTRVRPRSTGSRESGHGPWGSWSMESQGSGHGPRGHGPRGHESWVTVHGVTRVRPWSTGSRELGHGPRGHEGPSDITAVAAHVTLRTVTGVPPKTRAKEGSGGGVGTRSLGWGGGWTQPCTPGASSLGNPFPAWPSVSLSEGRPG